ncbi:hypothetical protein M407DRAFT_27506 [Tulasnella calospora MUT 4182]|uniref:Virilizer N-terminal domain-containing protein n=1 Tax=Tulasnella calospora MUT 4182 TaxID=1051891 RepID=A0A0C3QDS5_9AGAM|nr:hypothetical protein M407DRAFT_27506 [Tulasnella calospora MUT 4182]
MLLLWAPALVPQGQSNLVAIRFKSAVCIDSIQIVPRGVSPFLREPHVVGETAPESFSIRIFMNTQSSGGDAGAQVKGPANTLASASLRFDGGLVDHIFSTRLLIFQGEFQRMSVAIYGTPAGESKLEEPLVESDISISSRSARISETLDPLVLSNPLTVAQALLRRTPDTQVSLGTIIPKCLGQQDQIANMNGNGAEYSMVSEPLPVLEDLLQAESPDDELVLDAVTELGALLGDAEIDNQTSIKDAKVIVAAVALLWTKALPW